MNINTKTIILLATLLLLMGACGPAAPALQEATPTPEVEVAAPSEQTTELLGTIVLADISSNPDKKIKRFQPLADYLAAHLAEFGIGSGEVRIAPDLETMASWLAAGAVDICFDSLYPTLILSDQTGAQPILRRWKGGVGEYHTVIFALAEQGFDSVDDLRGEMVAFDEPASTSGYLVPLAYLLEAGLTPVEQPSVQAAIPDDIIGYTFSGDDENTIQWVISGRAAAGVIDSEEFKKLPEETLAAITILAETEAIPRQVAVVAPDMSPELVEAITTLLVELDETEEGQSVLEAFKTSQFDAFPQGIEATLADMRAMYDRVQGQ